MILRTEQRPPFTDLRGARRQHDSTEPCPLTGQFGDRVVERVLPRLQTGQVGIHPELLLDADVVAPFLKGMAGVSDLALKLAEPRTLLAAARLNVRQGVEESVDDRLLERPVILDREGCVALPRLAGPGVRLAAEVPHVATLERAPLGARAVPASGAAQQWPDRRHVRGLRPELHATPADAGERLMVDERLVRVGVTNVARVGLTDINRVAQDVFDRPLGPNAVPGDSPGADRLQPVAEFCDTSAAVSTREQLGHDRAGDRIDDERARPAAAGTARSALTSVAERGSRARVDAAHHGARLRVCPVAADAVELELREAQHDPEHEPARVGRQIKAVSDRHEGAPGVLDPFDHAKAVYEAASEAVELRDDDPVYLAALDPFDRSEQLRTISASAALVEFLVDNEQLVPVRLDVLSDAVALLLRADEAVALAAPYLADADISVESESHVCLTDGTPPCAAGYAHPSTERTCA